MRRLCRLSRKCDRPCAWRQSAFAAYWVRTIHPRRRRSGPRSRTRIGGAWQRSRSRRQMCCAWTHYTLQSEQSLDLGQTPLMTRVSETARVARRCQSQESHLAAADADGFFTVELLHHPADRLDARVEQFGNFLAAQPECELAAIEATVFEARAEVEQKSSEALAHGTARRMRTRRNCLAQQPDERRTEFPEACAVLVELAQRQLAADHVL